MYCMMLNVISKQTIETNKILAYKAKIEMLIYFILKRLILGVFTSEMADMKNCTNSSMLCSGKFTDNNIYNRSI